MFASHSQRHRLWYEIKINAPRCCPVCGSKDVRKLIRIGATNLGFLSPGVSKTICIKIWTCEGHEKLKTPSYGKKFLDACLVYEFFQGRSIIHAAREDWIKIFTALNASSSVTANCKPFDVNSVALARVVSKLIFGWLLSISLFIATLIINHPDFLGPSLLVTILITTFMVITMILLIVHLIGICYLDLYKIPVLRERYYFGEKLRGSWRDYLVNKLPP